jgi:hypothetical protein
MQNRPQLAALRWSNMHARQAACEEWRCEDATNNGDFALLLCLLLMQPPRLALALVFLASFSPPSPPPLPYRIVAPLTLARLLADGADGLIRGLTIVRRLHFFHLPRPPASTHIFRSPAAAACEKISSTRMAVVQHASHVPVADRAWTYSCRPYRRCP